MEDEAAAEAWLPPLAQPLPGGQDASEEHRFEQAAQLCGITTTNAQQHALGLCRWTSTGWRAPLAHSVLARQLHNSPLLALGRLTSAPATGCSRSPSNRTAGQCQAGEPQCQGSCQTAPCLPLARLGQVDRQDVGERPSHP